MNESLVKLCEDLGVSLAQLELELREGGALAEDALAALQEQGEAQLEIIRRAIAARRVQK